MEIILTEEFRTELKLIVDFYMEKSEKVASDFLENLFEKIDSIPFMTYRFRKNSHFRQENIRDLIFKGYVIPFIVEDDQVKILSIYRRNLPRL